MDINIETRETARKAGIAGLLLTVVLCVIWIIPSANAASFDCNSVVTVVEKLICSDSGLSKLDERMSEFYRILFAKGGPTAEEVRNIQQTWLRAKRNLCTDRRCLDEAYRLQIATLSIQLDKQTSGTSKTPRKTFPASWLGISETYPPYPNVWHRTFAGGALPIKFMDNGDYLVTGKYTANFFGGYKVLVDNSLRFAWEERIASLPLLARRYDPISFSDGSFVQLYSGAGSTKCSTLLQRHIIKYDREKKMVAQKHVIIVNDSPVAESINPYCENSGGRDTLKRNISGLGTYILPLKDDSFLVFSISSGHVVRLNSDLQTFAPLVNKTIFIVDVSTITKLINEQTSDLRKQGKKINLQIENDILFTYLIRFRGAQQ